MSKKTVGNSELLNKIFFTLIVLAFYRAGSFVPLPFIDPTNLSELSDKISKGVFGMFDMLSGGSLSRMSIFALGIVPYITSSIIVQLLTASFDSLKHLKQEGETGQIKINKKNGLPKVKNKKVKITEQGWHRLQMLEKFLMPLKEATVW